MSQRIYIVDNLVDSLKNRGLPPTSQSIFTTDQFINILSEEMMTNIVPLIDSVSEEYFVTNKDISFDGSTTTFSIPPRSIGGKLRDVVFVDSSGLEINIPRLRPEDIKTRSQFIRYQPAPWGYFLQNNSVVLFLGVSNATGTAFPTLRLKFIRRPNILTASTNCGQVLSIVGNVVTLDNAGSTWTSSTTFDFIANNPNFSSLGDDQTITNIAGFVLTFSSAPTNLAVGDWVAEANYSPIPQIPVEGHYLLAQYGAAKVLEAIGDVQGMNAALQKAESAKEPFLKILNPRVEGSVIKLVSRGGVSEWMNNQGWF